MPISALKDQSQVKLEIRHTSSSYYRYYRCMVGIYTGEDVCREECRWNTERTSA